MNIARLINLCSLVSTGSSFGYFAELLKLFPSACFFGEVLSIHFASSLTFNCFQLRFGCQESNVLSLANINMIEGGTCWFRLGGVFAVSQYS